MAYTTNPKLPEVRRRARELLAKGWSTRKVARHLGYTQGAIVKWSHRKHIENEPPIPTQHMDEAVERRQVERVRALRHRRDAARSQAALRLLVDHARGGDNLMPSILDAVESECTVGEISAAMRTVFGEYQETVVI